MDQPTAVTDLLVATLTELGAPAPSHLLQTMLIHDGFFVGYKFRYDGGHAVWRVDGKTLEVYDKHGALLKTTTPEDDAEAAA